MNHAFFQAHDANLHQTAWKKSGNCASAVPTEEVVLTAKHAKYAKGKCGFEIVRVARGSTAGLTKEATEARHICRNPIQKMKSPVRGGTVEARKHLKMSLLTELEILRDGFLQRCRTYGA